MTLLDIGRRLQAMSATGAPVSFTYSKNTFDSYLFGKNIQGDILYIYDMSGNRIVSYAYDAWGNILSVTGTKASTVGKMNPFRYRGYYYDTETGFYYLNSRYYDPAVGRFINADGFINGNGDILGYNFFAYCSNNPVMFDDPYGYAVASLFSDERLFGSSFRPSLLGGGGSSMSSYVFNDIFHTEIEPTYDSWSRMQRFEEWLIGSGLKINSPSYTSSNNGTSNTNTDRNQSSNNGACFIAGTQVETENGSIPIEKIEAGMRVYSHDPDSGETDLKEVVQTFVRKTDKLVHIEVRSEDIVTTPTHPFYVPKKGWTEAIQLRAGDRLQLLNGEYVVIEQVQHELLESPVTVYNFEVEGFHTYFVSDNAVLVHNKCEGKPFSPDQRALIELAKEYGSGVSLSDANILVGWANEYGISYHYPDTHPGRSGYWSDILHIKIYKYHIMVFKE